MLEEVCWNVLFYALDKLYSRPVEEGLKATLPVVCSGQNS